MPLENVRFISLRAIASAFTITFACAGAPAAVTDAGTGPQSGSTAFVDVTVISMERDGAQSGQTVIVRDGRIVAMGPASSTAVPEGARRIDGRGKFLIPGLYDMHAHLAPGTAEGMDGAGRQLSIYLALGVTSVRALAAPPSGFALKSRIASGAVRGPHLWVTGQSINGQTAPTPEAAEQLVNQMALAGADVIKTHGMWQSRAPYDAMVRTAKQRNLPLSGHVTPEFGLAGAVDAGQQIEHLDGMIASSVPAGTSVPPGQFPMNPAVLALVDSARVDSIARVMAARRIHHGPTLALFRVFAGNEPPEVYLSRPDVEYTPAQALNQWTLHRRNQLQQPVPAEVRERYLAVRDMMVRRFQALGVPLLAGSDGPQLFMVPGFGVHRELEAMVRAGLTPYEALLSATRTPAAYLGKANQSGTITVGKEADLVLLDANPLTSITNTMRVQGTMLRGEWLDKATLDEMRAKVKEAVAKL